MFSEGVDYKYLCGEGGVKQYDSTRITVNLWANKGNSTYRPPLSRFIVVGLRETRQ